MTDGVWYECNECSYATNSELNALDHIHVYGHDMIEFEDDYDEIGHIY